MNRPFRFLIAMLGCLHLCGGHFGVMQGVAWIGMIIDYSAEDGLSEGVRQTFSGKRPCHLCVAIAEAKKETQESPLPSQRSHESKLELKPCPIAEPLRIDTMAGHQVSDLMATEPEPLDSHPRGGPEPPPPRFA